jgi:hypothetical protein
VEVAVTDERERVLRARQRKVGTVDARFLPRPHEETERSMNTKAISDPLFKDANELHESLVQHAKDALVEVEKDCAQWGSGPGAYRDPRTGKTSTITRAEYRERRVDWHLRDRMAQIAGAIWLDAEIERERR